MQMARRDTDAMTDSDAQTSQFVAKDSNSNKLISEERTIFPLINTPHDQICTVGAALLSTTPTCLE